MKTEQNTDYMILEMQDSLHVNGNVGKICVEGTIFNVVKLETLKNVMSKSIYDP